MKAFILDKCKNGALRFGDMPEPVLQDDDVLVEIHAAGPNLLDSKIRSGEGPGRIESAAIQTGGQIYARPRDGRVGTFAEF